jgi:type II secretory pathway component GspD/PulD (secretin)
VQSRRSAPVETTARQLYVVRSGSAAELADVLNRHFQAEPGFHAVPDVSSNYILLSGSKSAVESAVTVLREIDRSPRTVRVEIVILELSEPDAKAAEGISWSGTAREVMAKVQDLQQKGVVVNTKTVELATVEGQLARSQVQENRPYVTGVMFAGGFGGRGGGGGVRGAANRGGAAAEGGAFGGRVGGRGPRGGFVGGDEAAPGPFGGGTSTQSISYRSVGTSVKVKPEVTADGQVSLDLTVEDARMRTSPSSPALGADDRGTAVRSAEFISATLETRLKVRSGHIVLAGGMKASAKAGQAQTVVLVTASTDESSRREGR